MRNSEERIDYIISEVKSTQAIEGLNMPKDEEEIYRKYLKGKISEEEVLKVLNERLI